MATRMGVAFWFLFVMAGCGSDSSGDPMLRYSDATCDKLAQCSPSFIRMYFGDLAACKVREYETIKPLLDLPGLEADWAGCAAETEAVTCGVFIREHTGEMPVGEACGWRSTLQDGTPCSHPYQCASLVCARKPGASCGTCVPALATGADCDGNHLVASPCGIGSTCANGKCVVLGDTGDSCDPNTRPCHSDLGCIDGTCGPARQVGEPCSSLTGECDLLGKGLACHPGLGTCVEFGFAGPGEACGITETGATVCALGNCYPSLLAGTCTAQVADGASCDTTVGPDCLIHAQCVGGKCEQFFTPPCL